MKKKLSGRLQFVEEAARYAARYYEKYKMVIQLVDCLRQGFLKKVWPTSIEGEL